MSWRSNSGSPTEPPQPAASPAVVLGRLGVTKVLVSRVTVGQVRLHRALLADNSVEMATRAHLAWVDAGVNTLRERKVDANLVCTLAA